MSWCYAVLPEAYNFTALETKTEIDEFINHEIRRPFDLKIAPLLRVSLISKSQTEHILVIVAHHIIIDGTSFTILIRDLNFFYNQAISETQVGQHEASLSYFKHIAMEKEVFSSKRYMDAVSSTADLLQNSVGLNFLTTPLAGGKDDVFSGDRVYFTLDKKICSRISEVSKSNRVTLFHFLLSVYCIFLNQYTRSQDILVGVPFANREHDPEQQIIGYFVNTLPLRIKLDLKSNFVDLMLQIKTLVFSYLCKQNITFEHLATQLNLDRKLSGLHPMIQTMFVWGSSDKLKLNLNGVESKILQKYFSKTSKFDISLFMLNDSDEGITAYFEYRSSLFNRLLIENMVKSFTILINNILDDPGEPLNFYSMLNAEERSLMRENFFTGRLDRIVTNSLVDIFKETADKYFGNTALIFGENEYTYSEVEMRSNFWANYIRDRYKTTYGRDMPNNTLIALYVDRGEDMIFGMLGILKSGAAYVPIDPEYPKNRVNYIITHSKSSLLLTLIFP